jgi:hypothetical protein
MFIGVPPGTAYKLMYLWDELIYQIGGENKVVRKMGSELLGAKASELPKEH